MNNKWPIIFRVTVLSIALGGASGIVTAALTGNYLTDYATQLAVVSGPPRLAEERPYSLPDSLGDALKLVKEVDYPTIAQIYMKADNEYGVYEPQDAFSSGVVITSDGWIVTVSSFSAEELARAQVVLDKSVHPVTSVIDDTKTNVVFLKIDASNLPVVPFGNAFAMSGGDRLFLIESSQSIVTTSVRGFERIGPLESEVETPNRIMLVSTDAADVNSGSLAANAAGELVGVVDASGDSGSFIIPISNFLPSVNPILREGKITRAAIGISIIDLTYAIGLDGELSRGNENGALVTKVEKGSAADLAGIKVDDIVTEVNGQAVNGKLSLTDYLLAYKPGDTIALTLDRGGEEAVVEVIAGSE